MRSDIQTSSRPRRRALGLVVALLTVAGVAVTGCGDNTPATPAISGNSPGDVSVPTVPPTTATTVPGTDTTVGTDTTTTTAAP